MKIKETKIIDCLYIECDRYFDDRGFFQQLHSKATEPKLNKDWQQTNWSHSIKNILRGIHEADFWKLVTCISGDITDIVIDLRPESKTYLQYEMFSLFGDVPSQVLIPPGCGHGFITNEPSTVMYMQNATYKPGQEKDWNYQSFKIDYPKKRYIISDRDKNAKAYS